MAHVADDRTDKDQHRGRDLRCEAGQFHQEWHQGQTQDKREEIRCHESQELCEELPTPGIGPEGDVLVEDKGIHRGDDIAQDHGGHVSHVAPRGKMGEQRIKTHENDVPEYGIPDTCEQELEFYFVFRGEMFAERTGEGEIQSELFLRLEADLLFDDEVRPRFYLFVDLRHVLA